MGDQTPLLQLVDEIARFTDAVKRVAAKRHRAAFAHEKGGGLPRSRPLSAWSLTR
jgi:hypothetical protein